MPTKQQVVERYARGQCVNCRRPRDGKKPRCRACRAAAVACVLAARAAQVAAGRCVHPNCQSPPDPGRRKCGPHRRLENAQTKDRRAAAKARESRVLTEDCR